MRHNHMKHLNLITLSNSFYSEQLAILGYSVTCHSVSGQVSEIKSGVSILELNDHLLEAAGAMVNGLKRLGKVICLCENHTEAVKRFLISNGIPDMIRNSEPARIAAYIEAVCEPEERYSGLISIFDENPANSEIISAITSRFGVRPVVCLDEASFFATLAKPGIEMMLVNLGTESLVLQTFLKKALLAGGFKSVPLVAYKDMKTGLFVHELVSGLNRITKVVLSIEELFYMLFSLLFNRELYSNVSSISSISQFEKKAEYSSSLSQIYHTSAPGIFEKDSLYDSAVMAGIYDSADMIKRCICKAEGLMWMKLALSDDFNACARGG